MGGYVSGEITNKPRWQISTLNAAQNLFCLGWSRCIVTFLLTKHANCDIILRGSGKNVWKVASMKATLKVFQSGKGCVSSSCFLTTWCGWFHMSNRPQSPSSWGESPRWLVVVMVAWCWRHQGQACVVKVCAQRVQETEYCRQHTHMQQHWILKQCWATAWDRILRQYWMYSSTIRNKCIPLNTASTTILSELYLYLSSGICVFVMMINSAILKTASTRIHTCTWVQCTWALHYLHCSIQSYHYIWYIAPGSQVVWVFQKDASLKADLCTHTPVFWHALKQSI